MPTPKTQPKKPLLSNRKKPNRTTDTRRKEIENDLDEALSYEVLLASDAGQQLLENLFGTMTLALDTLLADSALLTLPQILDLCARIRERWEMIRTISGAPADIISLRDLLKQEIEREAKEKKETAENAGPLDNGMTDHSGS